MGKYTISIYTTILQSFLINGLKWGKEYIVYREVLLVAILQYYVEIMNELDITNYLTPRYLTELVDNNN